MEGTESRLIGGGGPAVVHLIVAAQEAEVRRQFVSLRALAEPRHTGRGLQGLAVHEPVDERVDGGVRVAQ